MVSVAVTANAVSSKYVSTSILQSVFQIMTCVMIWTVFVYIPTLNQNKAGNRFTPSINTVAGLRQEIFDIVGSPDKITEVMQMSCESMCAENMLALFEIRDKARQVVGYARKGDGALQ